MVVAFLYLHTLWSIAALCLAFTGSGGIVTGWGQIINKLTNDALVKLLPSFVHARKMALGYVVLWALSRLSRPLHLGRPPHTASFARATTSASTHWIRHLIRAVHMKGESVAEGVYSP